MHYLWSSVLGKPVVELDHLGGVYRAYVYGPGGQLLALQANDYQFYWVHTDHLGSVRRLTNGSGTEVYRAEFDPHGQLLDEWAPDGKLYKNSRKFTGYERDWTTKLDNAKARMYASKVGRFLQPDPLGVGAADATNPQSLNRYSYVGNDLVNFVDPSGLMPSIGCSAEFSFSDCGGGAGFWGGYFGSYVADYYREYGGLPPSIVEGLQDYNERIANAVAGNGFRTIREILGAASFNIYYSLYSDGSYSTFFSLAVNISAVASINFPRINYVKATVGTINIVRGGARALRDGLSLPVTLSLAGTGIAAIAASEGVSLIFTIPAILSIIEISGGTFLVRRGQGS